MIAIAPQPGEFSGTLPGVNRLPACRDYSRIIADSLSGKLLSKRSFRRSAFPTRVIERSLRVPLFTDYNLLGYAFASFESRPIVYLFIYL